MHGTTEEVPRSRTPLGKKDKDDASSGQGETWDWLQLEMTERLTSANSRQQQIPVKAERSTPLSVQSGDPMEANPPTQERIEEELAAAEVPDMPTMGGEECGTSDMQQLEQTVQKLKAELTEMENNGTDTNGIKKEIKEEPEDPSEDNDKERMKEQLATIEAEIRKLTMPAESAEKKYPCSLK